MVLAEPFGQLSDTDEFSLRSLSIVETIIVALTVSFDYVRLWIYFELSGL